MATQTAAIHACRGVARSTRRPSMNTVNEKKKGLKQKILHELIKYWLIVLYMAIFFGAFSSYRSCYWPIMELAMRTTELA